MSGIAALQGGQSDLELSAADAAVLLRPLLPSTPILTSLEATGGGLDTSLINAASGFQTVGNWTKAQGVTLTNNPTINDVKSHGKGSPTRQIASEAEKGITYEAQENIKLINLQNAWGFPVSAVSMPSAHGGFTIQIPELPTDILWQAVLLTWDYKYGGDVFRYWIANKANIGKRGDQKMVDSDVETLSTALNFQTHPALPGVPIVFGVCGAGFLSINAANTTGFYPAPTGAVVAPTTAALTVAAGVGHTQQLTVTDSNGFDRTSVSTFLSSAPTKATVSATGLITAVSAGTTNVTASWGGFTSPACAVTVS